MNIQLTARLIPALLATLAATAATATAQRPQTLSPYPAIRYAEDKVEVQHEKQWCELLAIDGIGVPKILKHCEERHKILWRKRFEEDLVQVLTEMGKAPGPTVDLKLIDLRTGRPFDAKGVAMTRANRNAVRDFRKQGGKRPAVVPLVAPGGSLRISPFRGMRETDGKLEVQVDDTTWYELQSIDGIKADDLRSCAKRNYGGIWWKRITEDLGDVFALLKKSLGPRVTLTLRDLRTGRTILRKKVAATVDKRHRLWSANSGKQPTVRKPSAPLDAKKLAADLDQLRTALNERFSYRHLREVDLDAAIQKIEKDLEGALVRRRPLDGLHRAEDRCDWCSEFVARVGGKVRLERRRSGELGDVRKGTYRAANAGDRDRRDIEHPHVPTNGNL